ncbi:enoyl-CoA hydratase/isomerase family protein [Ruegeria sp. HKCCD8929]|uniref:enoyl-CoA hydratase/isomerase family protein n=1 Tax=Ruegeria sp. HKCCD8929 TaxID=2683006 RepID=UPI0020C203E0|nr:enoyl-CoA hydratase/isomerase family protein [Ruegeria sp. HKCCD8929]
MKYENFQTFTVDAKDAIATVTFDFGTVNVQGQEMLADLNSLAMRLERDRNVKVVVFESANPEIWVCHYDTELLKDMSTETVSREEAQLLDLQSVCERISKVPQATIAKLEGFARGGGHELALALDMRFAVRGKFKFMQMEVGMGILPCGGGASPHGTPDRSWSRAGNHPERPRLRRRPGRSNGHHQQGAERRRDRRIC